MEILEEIETRHSARSFLAEPITREVLERILEAGRLAPSAKNRQAWRFVAVDDPKLRKKIADAAYGQECVQKAPCLIALCTTNIDYKMPNGQLSYPVDLGIASAFMMLQAKHEGIASCAISTFSEPEVRSILTVPFGMKIVLILAIGYSDEEQPHRERLPASRVFSFNSW